MNIDVHIERLVLDKLPSDHDARAIRRGLQNELTRLLREGGLSLELQGGGALPWVQGGPIRQKAHRSASAFGTGIASAVYQGIGR
jgi:hypothetical protein